MDLRALLASPLGFLIGLSLGALGGGGSILAVPVLVYVAGQTTGAATSTSLVLVGMTALVGIVPHWRAGHVQVRSGLVFGLVGVAGALAGSALNRRLDDDVLLFAFSGLMLAAGARMWAASRCGPAPITLSVGAAARTDLASSPLDAPRGGAMVARVVLAGSIVGLLTGLFGVGGGFVIVPALVLALGFSMPDAVGTSLLVIVINAAVALSSRLGAGDVDWAVVLPFAVSSMAGVIAGSRLAARRAPRQLQRWFVVLLVLVAVYTATSSAVALWT